MAETLGFEVFVKQTPLVCEFNSAPFVEKNFKITLFLKYRA